MAKRIIQECDLTKQEYDPDETVIITIKKKGKSKGRTYDLSPEAAAKLEQQLVAGSNAILNKGWNFFNIDKIFTNEPIDDIKDDEELVTRKIHELRVEGVIIGSKSEENSLSNKTKSGNCIHLNKSGIKVTADHKKYRTCNACGESIAVHNSKDRIAYMTDKLPRNL